MLEARLDLIENIHFMEGVSTKIHGVMEEAEILRVIREEFVKSKELDAFIFLLTDGGTRLRIGETSLNHEQLKMAERIAGVRIKGFRFDLNKTSVLSQVVRREIR
jgi:hypothetical protein